MALSNQIGAYEDCFDVFERALTAPSGVRVQFPTRSAAHTFGLRMQQGRALQRKESMRLHKRDEPGYNKSSYDVLVVRQPREDEDGLWWVYVERQPVPLAIEEL